MGIVIKSPAEIEAMRRAGQINARALYEMSLAVRAGVTTLELDRIAAAVLARHGATPAFLNYPNRTYPEHPYPAVINASINGELVHGLPSRRRLKTGDILSLDCGAIHGGFVGDSAITVPVGTVSDEARRLIATTAEALEVGIAQCVSGKRLGDVSAAIQAYAEERGYQVAREYTGHGVGRDMHEEPDVPNWGKPDRGVVLKPGMVLALEPMLIVGSNALYTKTSNHWTVATVDGSLCAHFEHTIAITEQGPDILTKWEETWTK
ncbi:MAG: type I methionyl aminopeptidase [Chloroflexi bacterium]|mgnify:CR=1 FL=1|nr:type I methionyl aminopeptidase [Chloroflexota bacterium]